MHAWAFLFDAAGTSNLFHITSNVTKNHQSPELPPNPLLFKFHFFKRTFMIPFRMT